MAQKFIYLSNEFSSVASHLLGSTANELSQLQNADISIPKAAVIPTNTLKVIAQANNLQAQCYKLVQATTFSSSISIQKTTEQLKKLITNLTIPKELGSELLKTYHRYFSDQFVKIQTSNKINSVTHQIENIHSDTNMVTAVLDLWAEIITHRIENLQSKSHAIHEILFASPILILEQIEPKASGIGITFDTSTGSKQRITIRSAWGVYTPTTDFDTYYGDIRTNNITQKNIRQKTKQYRRVLGKLRSDEVLKNNQSRETLTSKQLTELIETISIIKRKYLSQLEIGWAYKHDRLVIESVSEVELNFSRQTQYEKKLEHKKLFVTIPVNKSTVTIPQCAKGLAVLNSGQLLSVTGSHPLQVAKTKQKKHLVSAVSRTINKFSTNQKLPVLYKASNYTANEYAKLSAGSVYESKEINPALGYRGGIRYISQQKAFEIELSILKEVLEKSSQPVGLLLPYVRTATEFQQLLSIIDKAGLIHQNKFSIWLELSTPANVLDLATFPIEKLGGIVFNPQSLHALMYGIDQTNSEIHTRYPVNISILKYLLKSAITIIKEKTQTISQFEKPEIYVDLTEFNKVLLQELYDLDFSGFIVNESVTELAKKCMIEKEQLSVV